MRVTILCLAPLEFDSRVLRLARAFAEAGRTTTVIGLAPAPAAAQPFTIQAIGDRGSPNRIRAGIVLRQAPATLVRASAHPLYWISSTRGRARAAVEASRPDLIIAVDWKSLPIAHAVAKRRACKVIYDSHELASEEFLESRAWRLLARQHVLEIERDGIARVDGVITVSDGLADRLHSLYGLPRRPLVVRNIPEYAPLPFQPTGSLVTVLYQGLLAPRRGLEAAIASVAAWRADYRLVIRGFGADPYVAKLREFAESAGVAPRVTFEPAVAPTDVVAAAHEADIGLFALPGDSAQSRFALPNKLFEYMAAGLALAVSDLPEMRRVIETCRCGILIPQPTPQAIAEALNALDAARIDDYKRASAEAAATQTFAAEFAKLLTLVDADG